MTQDELLSLEEIQDLRDRYLRGEDIPEDELRRALNSLRARRSVPTTRSRRAELSNKSLTELLGS